MKVFYKPRSEKGNLKRLPIDSESEPAHKICSKIKFQESIEHNLCIMLYDNKSGHQFKDNDIIAKDSILEYQTSPLSSQPL